MKTSQTILLLADRRQSQSAKALRAAGYNLLTSFTADHAVALCVNNNVDAVVLDQEHFVVTEGWSVAQSLKMIKAHICVLLVIRGKTARNELPVGIDAMVPQRDTERLLKALSQLL